MDRDVLQVFAGTYVAESDIDVKLKLHLINFIKEADEYEIIKLLKTGDLSDVQENEKEDLMTEYNSSFIGIYLNEAKVKMGATGSSPKDYYKQFQGINIKVPMSNTSKGLAAAAAVALVVAGAYAIYKRYFSKAAKACKGKSGSERSVCIKKFKIDAIKAQISALNSGMGKCAKTKNPSKCKAAIQNKVAKLKAKLGG